MDSVTHIVLGGAVAQLVAGRRAGYARTFLLGGLVATLPDLDMFLHTGNAVRDHVLHRHFSHSLAMVPVLALVGVALMCLQKAARAFWKTLLGAALLACASHSVLDALTSYGTVMFWPFSERRVALDVIAIVDPLFTLPLLVGVIWAMRGKTRRAAGVALGCAAVYMGFAWVQHERASGVQRDLMASRGVSRPANGRVLPQIGAVVVYRSVYLHEGRVWVDGIRQPYVGRAQIKAGGSLEVVKLEGLAGVSPGLAKDFESFLWFSDGYVARSPREKLLVGDLRYATSPDALEPVWGVQLEETEQAIWRMQAMGSLPRRVWRELFAPVGYMRLEEALGGGR